MTQQRAGARSITRGTRQIFEPRGIPAAFDPGCALEPAKRIRTREYLRLAQAHNRGRQHKTKRGEEKSHQLMPVDHECARFGL